MLYTNNQIIKHKVGLLNFTVEPIENGDLSINFGDDWNFQFNQYQAGHPYYLIGQINTKTQEQVLLDYLVIEGQAKTYKMLSFEDEVLFCTLYHQFGEFMFSDGPLEKALKKT